MTWSGEHTLQYTDDVLQNCTTENYIILLTNSIPTNTNKQTNRLDGKKNGWQSNCSLKMNRFASKLYSQDI